MKRLQNAIDRRILIKELQESNEPRTTISFYKYWNIGNPDLFRDYLYSHFEEIGVMGRIYVAHEGINAQISVPTANFDAFKSFLYSIDFLNGCRLNIAVDDNGKSFYKLKVKVRTKIVADGLNDDTFDVTDRGKHLSAEEFNTLTDDPQTIIVDLRNHYESEVGHFEGAILPDCDSFRDELPLVAETLKGKEERNIVMYCTGGIRCEKASAWFKHQGFQKMHMLDGGIIEYTRQAKAKGIKNKFKGKNFVFDERMAERISNDVIAACHVCGNPADTHINCANLACHVLFIECDQCRTRLEDCCSEECQAVIHLPEEEQKEIRKNSRKEKRIFHKGREVSLRYKKEVPG
jgi:UPF0176 protein